MRLLLSLAAMLALAACQNLAPAPAAGTVEPTATEPAPPAADAPPATPAMSPAPEVRTTPTAMDWLRPAAWSDLPGWQADDLTAAWPAWRQSCTVLQRQTAWREVCAEAARLDGSGAERIRSYFQDRFALYQVQQAEGGAEGLVTGYYEPLLRGSRNLTPQYRYPLRAPPEDLLVVDLGSVYPELKALRLRGRLDGNRVVPYFTRGDIEAGRAPTPGREIAWVDDPVELFFLQVQGSGRIQMDDGSMMRVGYADQNGHPYRSIGRWLVERGELALDKASMQGIKDWARTHPERLPELLAANPSYVFFRELDNHVGGPLGALGVPLTAERSLAVDPRAIPLGAPVWLAATRPNSAEALQRLMLAQDTGGAIKGNVRADFYWGFGEAAGRLAGAMKQQGRLWLLLPRDYPLLDGNGR
ncbi:MAG: murein transglycosylase A [Gallionellaceae bacterium]|nr:murein transglycosylase A [Gallionellaceae bacterium]